MDANGDKDMQGAMKNRHGIVTIGGIVICVLLALITGRDLLFGLVMGAIFSSGLGIGRRIIAQISAKAPEENIMPAKIIGPLAGAIVVGIITALILSAIQGAVDVSPMEGDDFIATIVKSFFDSAAALAVAAGVVAGGWANALAAD